MGIAKIAYSLLAELKKDYPNLSGSLLQLGRQAVRVNASQALGILKQFDIKPSIDLNSRDKSNINDITLFKSLGFESVESMDFSDYEKSTHIHDFNHPVPEQFHEKYDVIYDGGTTEHIFDFPASLRNIYKMLKVGGIIIHNVPANNYIEHGFYCFSPTVFYDYYSVNGFEILQSYVFQINLSSNKCFVFEYTPEKSYSIPSNGEILIWFVARKVDGSTCGVIPQQGTYVQAWSKSEASASALQQSEVGVSHPYTFMSRLKESVRNSQFLYSLLLPPAKLFGIANHKSPIIATYDYE